jgi:WD40 repeat protein
MPDPHASQARIGLADNPAATVGCGVLVSPRHVVTCAHVVAEALGDPSLGAAAEVPARAVPLSLPLLAASLQTTGRVVCWQPAREDGRKAPEDIAVLELSEPAPPSAEPAPLAALTAAEYTALDVHCFGFPRHIDEGVRRTGTCRGENALGRVQLDIERGLVEGGFSGTAAWDPARGAVIGLVVAARTEEQSAQLMPVRTLFAACPALDRAWRPRNPYKGLSAFEPADRADFFGRAALVQELAARVRSEPLVTLIGPSGSGKSSLIGAGLLPLLVDCGGWRVLCLRPGGEPFDALAGALIRPGLTAGQRVEERRRLLALLRDVPDGVRDVLREWLVDAPGERLLLVVDQLEELFTNAEAGEPAQARAFAEALATFTEPDASSTEALRVHWLLALRADFMGRSMEGPAAPCVAPERQFQVGPLDGDDLRAAVEGPAAALGVRFEPGVTDAMLAELRDAPGRLPLLQFALAEIWEHQHARRIDAAALRDIGGVRRALSEYADKVIDDLSEADRGRARRILVQLVRPAEHAAAPATRQVTSLRRIPARDRALLPRLAASRLVVTGSGPDDEPHAEIAHEALIGEWGRLRTWVEEDRAFRLWQEGLRSRLVDWEAHARDPGYLLTGPSLTEAEVRLSSVPEGLSEEERIYIHESRRRAVRRRRQAQQAAAVVLTGFALFAGVAGWQWHSAEQQRAFAQKEAQRATREADLAIARRLSAVSEQVFEENPGETPLAAMIAIDAQERRGTAEGVAALRRVLNVTPTQMPEAPGPADWSGLQISRDGRVLAYYREDSSHAVNNDVSPRSTVHILSGEDFSTESARDFEALATPVFSPDGRWLATGGFSRRLTLLDVTTGESLVDETARTSISPAFSPDGQTLYVARGDGVIERRSGPGWKVQGRLRFPVERQGGSPVSMHLDSAGTRLLLGDRGRAAYLVPAAGGEPQLLEAFEDPAVWYKSNNVTIAAAARDRPIGLTQRRMGKAVVWDLATGQQLQSFQGDAIAWSAGISPDGAWIATAARTGKVALWRVKDGSVFRRLDHGAMLAAMAVSPDGTKVATAGEDGSVIVWTVEVGEPGERLALGSEVETLVFDTADSSLLIGTKEGLLARVDPVSGRVLSQRQFDGAVADIAPSGIDGRVAVSIRATRAAMHWDEVVFIDRDTGRERAHLVRNGDFRHQTLDPTGARFATFDTQGHLVEIWDTASAQRVAAVADVDVSSLAFGADGRQLVIHTVSDRVLVVETETGTVHAELGDPGGIAEATFPPEEDRAIAWGTDGTIRAWDLASGAERWRRRLGIAGVTPRFSADGGRFALHAKEEGTIEVVASETGQVVASIPAEAGGSGTLSADGSRMLVRRLIDDPASPMGRSTEVEVWDVDTRRRLHAVRRPTSSVSTSVLNGGAFALASTTHGAEPSSELAVLDGATGRPAWKAMEAGWGSVRATPVRGEGRWVLVLTPDSLQLRRSADGHVIWRVDPVSYPEHAVALPGGEMIAVAAKPSTGEGDWQVYLYEAATGERVRAMPINGYPRHMVASADGAHVIVGGEGDDWRGLRAWRILDGALVGEIEMDAEPAKLSALSDPDLVAVRDSSNNLRVWRLTDGAEIQRIAHTRSAGRSVVARNEPRVLTASGASLRLWDLATGREIAHHVAQGEAASPRLNQDGRRVAYIAERPRMTGATGRYRVAVLWHPGVPGEPASLPIDAVHDLQFDRSGRYLLLNGRDGAFVRLVEVATLRTVGTLRPRRNGKFVSIDSDPDGGMLLVGELGRYPYQGASVHQWGLRVFDLRTLAEISRTHVHGNRFFALGIRAIAARGADERWRIFDPRRTGVDRAFEKDVYYELHTAPGSDRVLTPLHYRVDVVEGADGVQQTLFEVSQPDFVATSDLDTTGTLAAASLVRRSGTDESGELLVLDARDGQILARREFPKTLHSVHLADNGEVLVATRMQRSGIPTETGEHMLHWRWREDTLAILENTNPVRGIGVAPDGAIFATAEGYFDDEKHATLGERRLRIWRAADGKELARIPIDFNAYGLAFQQHGRYLAATGDHEVALFAADPWRSVTDFGSVKGSGSSWSRERPETLAGLGAVFGADGSVLAIGQENGLFLFDIETEEIKLLHEAQQLKRMAVSPHGRLLATSGNQFTTIWDMVAGEAISRIDGGGLSALGFGGNTGEDLFAIRDRRLLRLTWQSERLISEACKRFRNANWRNGRVRVIGEQGSHRCELSATR